MTAIGTRLRCQRGQGLVSALMLLAGVLLPLLFLVPLFARLEQARLTTEQTARDAVRAAALAPTADAAQAAAQAALARAQAETNLPLNLSLSGAFERGSALHAHAKANVALASLPLIGHFGTVTISGDATAPIDRYRSLITTP